ncbi:MAG: pentapeptide repeat-containing protein [Cyanobacteria bacterium J06641_5]
MPSSSRIFSYTIGLAIAALLILLAPQWARAQANQYYEPPSSYSNAELPDRDFSGKVLQMTEFSNTNLRRSKFKAADLRGAVMSASSLRDADLTGANLAYALAERVDFGGANLSDTIWTEAVLLFSTFENTEIAGADFTDAILDGAQVKELCQVARGVNPQTGIATRDSLGCR